MFVSMNLLSFASFSILTAPPTSQPTNILPLALPVIFIAVGVVLFLSFIFAYNA